jgi:hypothetical protein
MKYRFVRERENYEDYASGRVLLGMPGNPAFPVRLASEVFQRCAAIHRAQGRTGPFRLYDPCCGAAYHLTVIGYLHLEQVRRIVGSDIDPNVLDLAEQNLAMLSPVGLGRRMVQLTAMRDAFGKRSHADALASAERLRDRLRAWPAGQYAQVRLFLADATDPAALGRALEGEQIDIVFTDVPYGWHSEWQTVENPDAGREMPRTVRGTGSVWLMLESLRGVLAERTVVAVAADKAQEVVHAAYQRLQRLKVGKRQVVILRPLAHGGRTAHSRAGRV